MRINEAFGKDLNGRRFGRSALPHRSIQKWSKSTSSFQFRYVNHVWRRRYSTLIHRTHCSNKILEYNSRTSAWIRTSRMRSYLRVCAFEDDFGQWRQIFWAMAEHCSSPRVLELHEGERRSSSSIFQINVSNRAVFVEQVFNVLGANIGREVSHVNTTVIVSRGSSKPTAWHARAVVPEVSELACNNLAERNFKKKALPELRAMLSLIN